MIRSSSRSPDTGFFTSFFQASLVVLTIVTSAVSCKDDPVSFEQITENALFPLAPGRLFTFTTFALDTLSQEKGARFRSSLFVDAIVTKDGKPSLRVIDSAFTAGGAVSHVDTVFFIVENGDFLQWGALGFYPNKRVSTGWVPFFKKSEGVNVEYVVAQSAPDSAIITAKILSKESVALGVATVEAYKLEIKAVKPSGYVAYYYYYFSDGKGLVQLSLPVQAYGSSRKSDGYARLWQRQNF